MNVMIDSRLKAFNLNANEACIYSAIAAVSKSKGWYATYKSLANHLPFVISTKTIERAIKHLSELGLIQKRQNALFAVTNCLPPTDNSSAATDTLSPDNRQIVPAKQTNIPSQADNLYLIYNKENKERVRDNIKDSACDTIDTPNPSTSSSFDSLFDQLLSAYKAQEGNKTPSADVLTAARNLWDALPDYHQQQLLRAVQSGSWNKPRLDWLISDFNFREPTNYAGLQAPRGVDLYRVPIAQNKYALYTADDVKEFHIPNAQFFKEASL